MKLRYLCAALACAMFGTQVFAAPCEKAAVQAVLAELVEAWNNDGAAIGTSYKAISVAVKPGSKGPQGTFTNVVGVEIFEAGRNSTLQTSLDVDMQQEPNGTCRILSLPY